MSVSSTIRAHNLTLCLQYLKATVIKPTVSCFRPSTHLSDYLYFHCTYRLFRLLVMRRPYLRVGARIGHGGNREETNALSKRFVLTTKTITPSLFQNSMHYLPLSLFLYRSFIHILNSSWAVSPLAVPVGITLFRILMSGATFATPPVHGELLSTTYLLV